MSTSPSIKTPGSMYVRDLPPPVGMMTRASRRDMIARTASSCPSLNSRNPQILLRVARSGQDGNSCSSSTSITSAGIDTPAPSGVAAVAL